jgi:amino acid adenylation domain-containing protein
MIDCQWSADDAEAARIGQCFSTAIQSIISNSQIPIQEVDVLNAEGLDQLWSWNSLMPEASETCVHDLIQDTALSYPDKVGICSWDGDLTYREIVDHAGRLANSLVQNGLAPDSVVPICFEKSKWTAVVMLAVLQAGCAFVLLDPSTPQNRLRKIIQQTDTKFGVSSQLSYSLLSKLVANVVVVTENSSYLDHPVLPRYQITISPSSLMYIIFTSGTTGEPKGTMISHRSFASAIKHQALRSGFNPATRILDFASYSFDVSVNELMFGLATGSCICVPSEEDRKNSLTEAIVRFSVNTIDITPSVCRLLDPEEMPLVHTMILGGEQLRSSDIAHWPARVRIVNCYGPSECSPTSTINDVQGPASITSIGKGAGAVTWVVDPANHNALAPPGTVGELLIEGPIVGQGYLGDASRTAASFIHDPEFLLKGSASHAGRHGRLYKTGDLVRYQGDGRLTYMGRKDTQVKLRGQRVELQDIEHHSLACLPTAKEVVVEVIRPSGEGGGRQSLAAFVLMDGETIKDPVRHDGIGVSPLSSSSAIEDSLSRRLPTYMVPTVWFAVDAIPLTSSGKTDRRKLRDIGSSYTVAQISQQGADRDRRKPTTDLEKTLQSLWSSGLGIEASHIGLDDNFFRLGGDSLRAMSLVAAARKAGLGLSVAQIFQHPRLGDLASELLFSQDSRGSDLEQEALKPFSLLSVHQKSLDEFVEQVAQLCSVDTGSVEDVYPTTPLQQGLMALTAQRPGDYVLQNVMQIDAKTDLHRLQQSWEEAVRRTPTLRTRIIQQPTNDAVLQVVVKNIVTNTRTGIPWKYGDNLDAYLELDKSESMQLGEPLTRFAIILDETTKERFLVWTIHHAVYDGQSLSEIQSMVRNFYFEHLDVIPSHQPFNNFVHYLLKQDEQASRTFWHDTLAGYDSAAFPPIPTTLSEVAINANVFTGLSFELPPPKESSVTLATVIRAAWAQAVYYNTGTSDVIFGATLSGRTAPVAGIEHIIGPTIATMPVRINIPQRQASLTVMQFLLDVQLQSAAMIPHEQFGLQRISKISEDAQKAADFKTLLVIQPHEDDNNYDDALSSYAELGVWREAVAEMEQFSTYPLTLVCRLSATGSMHLGCSLDPRVIQQWKAERILQQFGCLVRQLSSMDLNISMGKIDGLMPSDRELLWSWNSKVPDLVDDCLHELIQQRAKIQPNAPAIHAWDGYMSYSELDVASSNLASHLVGDLGLVPDTMVPLCFDKSIWAVVSMLAVLKAGCAFVPLDSAWTAEYRDKISIQIDASMILTSEQLAGDMQVRGRSEQVIAVGPQLQASIAGERSSERSITRSSAPSSVAYVIFTSGSTGQPKGVVLQHRAVATSCMHHGQVIGLKPSSRVLQFASYAFDASIDEIITTLVYGGTVCVPSEYNRKNNLTQSIQDMDINTAYLTPSVTRIIDPVAVPGLKTLMLAGEASRFEGFRTWSRPGQTILHGYGPTECAVLCCVATVDLGTSNEINSACIGTATGGTSWIVDPDDHNTLQPIGAVGELLIEGHILAMSYLHDQAKTEAAFIDTPTWLSQGANGLQGGSSRGGRLYKTGDLVSYNQDGSLNYIGRKDSQVKIRGQRVELAGVESSVQECLSNAVHVVAEMIKPANSNGNPELAVFVVLTANDAAASFSKTHSGVHFSILPVPKTFESQLSDLVPSYMVPSVCFVIDKLPLNTSGKADRKKLREVGSSLSATQLATLKQGVGAQKRPPVTDAEKVFCDNMAKVLNVDATTVGLDDSFFQLGGDSITAMQLASAARLHGLKVSVGQIMRLKTVSRILEACGVVDDRHAAPHNSSHDHDQDDSTVTLAPIQKMFFLQQKNPKACFDQYFYLRTRKHIAQPRLQSALHSVVVAHPILRARFTRDSGGEWEQTITKDLEGSVRCISQICSDYEQVTSIIRDQRRALDITAGPMVAAILFEVDGVQSLFIVIHHLVVDLVSWRIILNDLETLLLTEPTVKVLLAPPTTSFQAWSSLQAQRARELAAAPQQQLAIAPPQLSYWTSKTNTSHLNADMTSSFFSIDEETTTAIFGACNDVMGTKPIELMISALLFSFGQTFKDRILPTILNEGHGRGTWDESLDLDLSRTVGWFTTLHPVHVPTTAVNATNQQQDGLLDLIAQTQKAISSESSAENGATWFTSQFATPQSAKSFVHNQLPAEIVFNYGGVYQQLERDDSLFEVTSLAQMAHKDTSSIAEKDQHEESADRFNINLPSTAEAHMSSLFEFVAGVSSGRLHISMLYSKHLLHQEKINEWFAGYEKTLRRIARELGTGPLN